MDYEELTQLFAENQEGSNQSSYHYTRTYYALDVYC